MRLHDLFENELLTEVDWYEKSPLPAILRRYSDKWIHFSRGAPNRIVPKPYRTPEPDLGLPPADRERALRRAQRRDASYRVPKIGINPVVGMTSDTQHERQQWASHHDPGGVYGYKCSFLLTGTDRMKSGQQYGLDMPYYYIFDVNMTSNGVDLGKVTWEQVEDIAERNGWSEPLGTFFRLSPEAQKKQFPHGRPEHPGWMLWNFVDRLVRDNEITWNKAFKGLDYIYDPNLSIIHSNEPEQIVVFNPKVIKVITSGENKPYRDHESDKPETWDHALRTILKTLRGEFGGTLAWQDKKPTLTFTAGAATFTVATGWTWGTPKLSLDYRQGRAVGHSSVGGDDFRSLSIEQIVAKVRAWVEPVARRKSDLLFTPALSEGLAQRLLRLAADPPLTFATEIRNDDGPGRNSMTVTGDYEREVDEVAVGGRVWLTATSGTFRLNAVVRLMGQNFMTVDLPGYEGRPPEDVDAVLDELAQEFQRDLAQRVDMLRPREGSTYWQRFQSNEEADAFVGWLAKHSGLSFGGRVEKVCAEAIAAYEAFPHKGALASDIRYLLRRW